MNYKHNAQHTSTAAFYLNVNGMNTKPEISIKMEQFATRVINIIAICNLLSTW